MITILLVILFIVFIFHLPWQNFAIWQFAYIEAFNNFPAIGGAQDIGRLVTPRPFIVKEMVFQNILVPLFQFKNLIWLKIRYFMFTLNDIGEFIGVGQSINDFELIGASMKNLIETFKPMTSIVLVSTILSATAISLYYLYVIFSNYILSKNENKQAFTMTFFKRTILASIFVLVAPTIMINSYVGSIYLGSMVGKSIVSSVTTPSSTNNTLLSYYYFNQQYGISMTTWCNDRESDRPKSIQVASNDGPYVASDVKSLEKLKFPRVIKSNSDFEPEKKAWEIFCEKPLVSIRSLDYIIYHPNNTKEQLKAKFFDKGKLYPSAVGQRLIDDVKPEEFPINYENGHLNIFTTLSIFISLFFSWFVLKNSIFKLVDLISSILMLWYYAKSLLSPSRAGDLGLLIKNNFKICLTQFYIITMYAIFQTYLAMNNLTDMTTVAFGLAFFFATVKGSNTIGSIVNSTTQGDGQLGKATQYTSKSILKRGAK